MTVIMPKKVYLTIVAASVRYANQRIPKDEWLEVSGVFTGKNEGKKKKPKVVLTAAYPIMHQELDKDAVIDQYKWADEDYEALYIIDDEAFSRDEFVVGWWHSHPGFRNWEFSNFRLKSDDEPHRHSNDSLLPNEQFYGSIVGN